MTRQQVEIALDNGQLYCRMANGNFWLCRRNGKTQTWKRRPDDFRIPIKIGFRVYGNITPHSLSSEELVISEVRP